jgi:hypothetical protein
MAELPTTDLCDKHIQTPVDVIAETPISIVRPGLLQ